MKFSTKTHWTYISICTRSGAMVFKIFAFLKYYNAWEWASTIRFTLGVNAAKNIDYIEKCFKQKFHRIEFPTKNKF